MEFQSLPENCIAAILSHTTPVDVCRLSSVSKIFRSAAESDAVWSHFLPSDSHFSSIISQSPLLSNSPSKKALYLALSDRPIIIDQGKQSFQLERKSGKKCYMLGARALTIDWGDTPQFWNWINMEESRFPEVAELVHVWWLKISGMINIHTLSLNTQYAVFLVFKLIDASGFENLPVELSVGDESGHSSTNIVCLDPNGDGTGLRLPSVRSDGWLEIEMGEFFNSSVEDELMQMTVLETKGHFKLGLFLEGIEVRPKEDNLSKIQKGKLFLFNFIK